MRESSEKRCTDQLELIAEGERILNRVLAYQAAIAVHQLKEELGLDVEALSLTVSPLSSDSVGTYRVVCTIVQTSNPAPIVLELVVDPENPLAANGHGGRTTEML